MSKKKPKQYKVNVPSVTPQQLEAPTNQGSLPVSSEVDQLRNQYNQQYSSLLQQSTAAEQAYQQQLRSLQGQYDQQVSLLGGQLGAQQQQYSLLQQQFAQAQEQAKTQYEQQKSYYDELLKQQQEQATRETEAGRRALAEAEQAQAGLQSDTLLSLNQSLSSSKSKTPLVSRTNLSTVTRGSQGYSLLRR